MVFSYVGVLNYLVAIAYIIKIYRVTFFVENFQKSYPGKTRTKERKTGYDKVCPVGVNISEMRLSKS